MVVLCFGKNGHLTGFCWSPFTFSSAIYIILFFIPLPALTSSNTKEVRKVVCIAQVLYMSLYLCTHISLAHGL